MEKNYLKIIFIIDESGSMSGSESDVIGGFNSFIEKQRKEEFGKISVSLYKFNSKFNCVIRNKPVSEVRDLTRKDYLPNSLTALYDAIGRTIQETDEEISSLPESERPDKVMVIIITDGHENASREFSGTAVRSIIFSHETTMGWNFIFLGSGLDDFTDADVMGMRYRAKTSKSKLTETMDVISSSTINFHVAPKTETKKVMEDMVDELNKLDKE